MPEVADLAGLKTETLRPALYVLGCKELIIARDTLIVPKTRGSQYGETLVREKKKGQQKGAFRKKINGKIGVRLSPGATFQTAGKKKGRTMLEKTRYSLSP